MSMGSGTKILLAELIMILVVLIVFWIVIVFIRSNAELRYLRDALRGSFYFTAVFMQAWSAL